MGSALLHASFRGRFAPRRAVLDTRHHLWVCTAPVCPQNAFPTQLGAGTVQSCTTPSRAPHSPAALPVCRSAAGDALPAGCGYQAAVQGRYAEAVQAFTEAIKLNPREHR